MVLYPAGEKAAAMSSWRDQILKDFTPKVARLTLAADPDGLLLEEGILESIRRRGFELIPFEDHITFRYAYESKFRSRWDRGEYTDLVVVLRSQSSDISGLPYDLLQVGRRLSFNLGDIFPNLSYPVVSALDCAELDALFEAQNRYAPDRMGDNATRDFILRHVFEIAAELVKQPSDLLRTLLRRHYSGRRIPTDFDERFIQILRRNNVFDGWPLETIVSDRDAFFVFLQERWPVFLDIEAAKETSGVHESGQSYGLSIEGPVELPFDHPDIKIYIDNLFVEGFLRPVSHEYADAFSKTWMGVGVRTDRVENESRRLSKLIDNLSAAIPVDDAKYTEWFRFARGWAEMNLLAGGLDETLSESMRILIKDLQARTDAAFTGWLIKRYAGLVNLPPSPPVMLHHLPRFFARRIEEDRSVRIALIVADGLALDQWLAVREALSVRQSGLQFREQSVFAWIPSLTSVSRQAAFAGKAPVFFPNSIFATDKEPGLWARFWMDQGLAQNEIVYVKNLGDGGLDALSETLSHPRVRVAGLVVDKIDKIMHGMEMGAVGMLNQVSQWARQPYLNMLLNLLLDKGFHVYLTSDHGNIEAEGCGCPSEGVAADLRGERVRIYSSAAIRGRVKERFPSAMEWDAVGLPEDCLALLAPARQAFVREKQRAVSHGGASVEEIIVPFIKIERKDE